MPSPAIASIDRDLHSIRLPRSNRGFKQQQALTPVVHLQLVDA